MNKILNRTLAIISIIIIVNTLIVNIASLIGALRVINYLEYLRYLNILLFYASIAVALGLGRELICQYNLDRTTIIIIILTGLIRSRRDIPFEFYLKGLILLLAAIVLYSAIKNWRYIPKTRWRWVGIGFILSIIVVPLSIIEAFQPSLYISNELSAMNLTLYILRDMLYNLSFIALYEETIFRGILWGSLRGMTWNENKIFWGQSLIFWLTHLSRIVNPITFFITIPVGTLCYSLMARYSKQVFPSIILHIMINTFGPLIVYYYLNLYY